MKNNRRFDYKTKKIKKLEEEIKSLSVQNKILTDTNNSLNQIIEEQRESLFEIEEDFKNMKAQFEQDMEEMLNAKRAYEDALRSAKKIQSDYSKEIGLLLNKLRKQK